MERHTVTNAPITRTGHNSIRLRNGCPAEKNKIRISRMHAASFATRACPCRSLQTRMQKRIMKINFASAGIRWSKVLPL
jgi:hypothetical protein